MDLLLVDVFYAIQCGLCFHSSQQPPFPDTTDAPLSHLYKFKADQSPPQQMMHQLLGVPMAETSHTCPKHLRGIEWATVNEAFGFDKSRNENYDLV